MNLNWGSNKMKRKRRILKDELGLSMRDIAELFGLSEMDFLNSTAKEKYITALERLYEIVKQTHNKSFEDKLAHKFMSKNYDPTINQND